MNIKRNQNGQAIVELTVALVGILAVFCGFLLISKLGIQNVDNIIKARGEADDNAISFKMVNSGDAGIIGASVDPAPFSGELQQNDFSPPGNNKFSLRCDLSMSYIQDNFAPIVGNPGFIFLTAAELTSGSYSSPPVKLDDLERFLYVDTASITLTDETFMPFMSKN